MEQFIICITTSKRIIWIISTSSLILDFWPFQLRAMRSHSKSWCFSSETGVRPQNTRMGGVVAIQNFTDISLNKGLREIKEFAFLSLNHSKRSSVFLCHIPAKLWPQIPNSGEMSLIWTQSLPNI